MLQIVSAKRPRPAIYLTMTVLAAILITASGCERNAGPLSSVEQSAAPAEEPMLLEDEPLLLLDEEPSGASSDRPAADNSRCFVCHANYLDEKIAVTHARAGVGCAKCHGPSDAHIADESWASGGNGTAPEIIYTRGEINPSCMKCHPREKIETTEHEPLFARSSQKVCTDCHGDHRLPVRRSKWK